MKKLAVLIGLCLIAAGEYKAVHLQVTQAELESEFPSLSWNGAEMGVAWMDGRDGNQEIYFRLADMDNLRLGSELRLTYSWTFDDHPKLCWTGSEFGMSFIHESRIKSDLMFQRLSREGKPLGQPQAIVRQIMLGKDTAIFWTGVGYGIVSTEFPASPAQGDLVYRFLDENGKVLGAPMTVAGGPGIKVPGSLCRSGSDFTLFYLEAGSRTASLLKLDPMGTPKGPAVRLNLAGSQAELPIAAFNGKTFMVTWTQTAASGRQVMVLPLTADGKPLSDPFPITTPGADRPFSAIAAGPDGFGIAWTEIGAEGRMLFFGNLSEEGKLKAPAFRLSRPRPVQVVCHRLEVCPDSKGYVIAWVDISSATNSEIILSRVEFSKD